MHKISALFLSIVVFSAESMPEAKAQGAVTTIAAGEAMNSVVDNVRSTILQTLSKLDQTVSSGTFLARMQLNNLLAEVDYHATQVAGQTFGQIGKTQQTFFENAKLAVKDFEELGNNISENADKIAERAEFIVGNTIGTNEPRLRSLLPRATSETSTKSGVQVTFDGSWLANATPTLQFGEVYCKLGTLTEPTAVFRCPKEVFGVAAESSNVRYASGTFYASLDRTFWQKVVGLFGFKSPVKSYPVSLAIVSDQSGVYTLSATALEDKPVTNTRTARYDTGAQHCVWGSETTLNISPAGSEWTIDVNSIELVLESGEMSRLQNVTSKGFQVYAVGHNSGNCTRVMGHRVAYDARGWANGHVTWSEFMTQAQPVTKQIFSGPLQWGDKKVFPLPDRTQKFVVNADFFNGRHGEYDKPETDEFIAIERDAANRSIRLSVKSISEAFK